MTGAEFMFTATTVVALANLYGATIPSRWTWAHGSAALGCAVCAVYWWSRI